MRWDILWRAPGVQFVPKAEVLGGPLPDASERSAMPSRAVRLFGPRPDAVGRRGSFRPAGKATQLCGHVARWVAAKRIWMASNPLGIEAPIEILIAPASNSGVAILTLPEARSKEPLVADKSKRPPLKPVESLFTKSPANQARQAGGAAISEPTFTGAAGGAPGVQGWDRASSATRSSPSRPPS